MGVDDVLNSDLLFASWQTAFSGLVTLAPFPGYENGNQEMSVVDCFALRRFPSGIYSSEQFEMYKKGGKFQKRSVMRLEAEKLFAKANSPTSLFVRNMVSPLLHETRSLFKNYLGWGGEDFSTSGY